MTEEQICGTTSSGAQRKSAVRWPLFSFISLCGLNAWLFPPTPRAADAGSIETWLTFVLTQLLVFAIAFAPILLLFSLVAWVASRRRPHIADQLGGVTVATTVLLLLAALGQRYGQYALHRDDSEAAVRERTQWEKIQRQSEAKTRASASQQSLSPAQSPSLVGASEGAAAANEREANHSSVAKIVTAFTTQGREGVTEDDFDPEFLKRLEQWHVSTLVAKAALVMQERQRPFDAEAFRHKLRISSVYVNMAGMTLAVTKIAVPGTRIVHVVGLRGDEFIRVACFRDSDQEIQVLTGLCGTQVENAFGIELLPSH